MALLTQRNFLILARFALFLVYSWFGILKVFDDSPATPLVQALFDQTLAPFLSFSAFSITFGLFEVIIGLLLLFPRLTRLALILLIIHMATVISPLLILPEYVWSGWFVPTLEGQYIVKNILIIALAFGLATDVWQTPLKSAI